MSEVQYVLVRIQYMANRTWHLFPIKKHNVLNASDDVIAFFQKANSAYFGHVFVWRKNRLWFNSENKTFLYSSIVCSSHLRITEHVSSTSLVVGKSGYGEDIVVSMISLRIKLYVTFYHKFYIRRKQYFWLHSIATNFVHGNYAMIMMMRMMLLIHYLLWVS